VGLFNGKHIQFYMGKNYIPLNPKLRQDIVKSFHDHKMAGHPGELETCYNLWSNTCWTCGIHSFFISHFYINFISFPTLHINACSSACSPCILHDFSFISGTAYQHMFTMPFVTTSTDSVFKDVIYNSRLTSFKFVRLDYKNALVEPKVLS